MRIEALQMGMTRSLLAALPKAMPRFPEIEAEAPPRPPAVPAGPPVPNVAMLVILSAADAGVERRRRMARDAERGLDALDRLHAELVAGAPPSPERLREIADWARGFDVPEDPVLARLLSDIDLRVRVELAKYDVQA